MSLTIKRRSMKRKMTSVSVLFTLLFTGCIESSGTKHPEKLPLPVAEKGDTVYSGAATFSMRSSNIYMEKISKYKRNDSSRIIKSGVAAYRHGYPEAFGELKTNAGEKYNFHMTNGTIVYLNSRSSLIFLPSVGKYMEIHNGEVYFEVNEDSTEIRINNRLKVIAQKGTDINITAYRDFDTSNNITVTLLKGRASLKGDHFNKILNKSNTSATFHGSLQNYSRTDADPDDALAWTRNTFNFSELTFTQLLYRICRWYDLELSIQVPTKAIQFSCAIKGEFKEPIERIIERINFLAGDIQCHLKGRKLIVRKK